MMTRGGLEANYWLIELSSDCSEPSLVSWLESQVVREEVRLQQCFAIIRVWIGVD